MKFLGIKIGGSSNNDSLEVNGPNPDEVHDAMHRDEVGHHHHAKTDYDIEMSSGSIVLGLINEDPAEIATRYSREFPDKQIRPHEMSRWEKSNTGARTAEHLRAEQYEDPLDDPALYDFL